MKRRDGRGYRELSNAPSHDSYRLRIERYGLIIALWVAVQPAKPQFRGNSALLDIRTSTTPPRPLHCWKALEETHTAVMKAQKGFIDPWASIFKRRS